MGPPKRDVRVSARDGRDDEALIIITGDMFAAGFDTRDISLRLLVPKAACVAALAVARERQRPSAEQGRLSDGV
jgi:hypothetical protein